ncbi:hypothetical protein ACMDZ0_000697 [Enterococcus hirae]
MALDRLILNRNKFKKNCEAFDIKGAHGSFFQTMNLYNSLAKTIYFLFFYKYYQRGLYYSCEATQSTKNNDRKHVFSL